MFIEYAKVTEVSEDSKKGGQLVSAIGQLSSKHYVKAELMSFKGVVSLPKTGDFVLIATLGEKEYLCLGVLERTNLKMKEGEIMARVEGTEAMIYMDNTGDVHISGKVIYLN